MDDDGDEGAEEVFGAGQGVGAAAGRQRVEEAARVWAEGWWVVQVRASRKEASTAAMNFA